MGYHLSVQIVFAHGFESPAGNCSIQSFLGRRILIVFWVLLLDIREKIHIQFQGNLKEVNIATKNTACDFDWLLFSRRSFSYFLFLVLTNKTICLTATKWDQKHTKNKTKLKLALILRFYCDMCIFKFSKFCTGISKRTKFYKFICIIT